MKWHHRLSRAYWLAIRVKRYPGCARELSPGAIILDQLELAMGLLWPLALRGFLMHRVDELRYSVIAVAVDVDMATAERCVADAPGRSIWFGGSLSKRYNPDVTVPMLPPIYSSMNKWVVTPFNSLRIVPSLTWRDWRT